MTSSARPIRPAERTGGSTARVDVRPTDGYLLPSTRLCIAVDNRGDGEESTDPAGGAGAWKTITIDHGNPLYAISCPSAGLCLATAVQNGTSLFALSSTRPHQRDGNGGGPTSQTSLTWEHPSAGVSCPSAHFCVLADNMGNVYGSRRPTSHAWGTSKLRTQQFDAISCASTSLCVAVDDLGDAFVLTN